MFVNLFPSFYPKLYLFFPIQQIKPTHTKKFFRRKKKIFRRKKDFQKEKKDFQKGKKIFRRGKRLRKNDVSRKYT